MPVAEWLGPDAAVMCKTLFLSHTDAFVLTVSCMLPMCAGSAMQASCSPSARLIWAL
jgi:hypothetical protein